MFSSASMCHPDYYFPAQFRLSRAALVHNFNHYRQQFPSSEIVAVVKANAYGHGLFLTAEVLHEAGAQCFGVAQLTEALRLREFFDEAGVPRPPATVMNRIPQPGRQSASVAPLSVWRGSQAVGAAGEAAPLQIMTWIYDSTQDLSVALEADLDLVVSQPQLLRAVANAAQRVGRRARIHLKVDTGMSRAGFTKDQFYEILPQLEGLCAHGLVEVIGLCSHFSCADGADEQSQRHTELQIERFQLFDRALSKVGIRPSFRHLAATSGATWFPQAHFEMLRIGLGLYGLSPNAARVDSATLGLCPVGQLSARIVSVKQVPAGEVVSYGGTWRAPTDRFLAIVPLGYGDGIPRQASGRVEVFLNGRRYPQVGRICMDQFMIDLGPALVAPAKPGDEVILFGDPSRGYPSVDEWAVAADTINYTIVTQLGARIPRIVV